MSQNYLYLPAMTLPVTPTPIQALQSPFLDEVRVQVLVKRDDLTHPEIMGNKWRKLKYNLEFARQEGFEAIGATMPSHRCCMGLVDGHESSSLALASTYRCHVGLGNT